jgi:tRNA dimethylallyltransferase
VTTSPRARVALVGTTASGKSALAHSVALELGDVEIATVDSMTLYREMDIGTAKATARERSEVTYHLLDLVDPDEEYTVAQFQRAAHNVESEVASRERSLIYVGGTGLYGRAVIDEFEIPGRFAPIRAQLEARARDDLAGLYEQLAQLDPVAASKMEPTNERRIVRALEVTLGAGRPFSSFGPGLRTYGEARVHQVGITRDLQEVDDRIERRFSEWMQRGFLDEVVALAQRERGLSRTASQAVGYREILGHLRGEYDLATATRDALAATRRLARRQRSWFARDPRIEWFEDLDAARQRLIELLNGPGRIVEH